MNRRFCSFLFVAAILGIVLPIRCFAGVATCHVMDTAGKSIANATVYIQTQFPIGIASVTIVTDHSGGFSVDLGDIETYRICMIDAPGFAPSGGVVVAGENSFRLGPPTQVSGKVVDEGGNPVSGAIVSAIYAAATTRSVTFSNQRCSYLDMASMASRFTVKTDLNGSYTITDLPKNSIVALQLNDPKYVTANVSTVRGGSIAPPLTALPGTSITGKVIRQDGKPIGALEVYVSKDGHMPDDVVVGADGSYKLTSLKPGTYVLSVGHPIGTDSFKAFDWAAPAPVSVSATVDVPGIAPDIILTSGAIIHGSVLDTSTKQPIPGVLIEFQDTQDGSGALRYNDTRTKTDKDGEFSAHVLPGKARAIVFEWPPEKKRPFAGCGRGSGADGDDGSDLYEVSYTFRYGGR